MTLTRKLAALVASIAVLSVGSSAWAQPGGTGSGGGGLRFGIQGRIDAMNLLARSPLGFVENDLGGGLVPIVAPGFRLLNDRLYLGLGLGFASTRRTEEDGDERSRSVFSLSPMVNYDLLSDDLAALYLLGWLNFLSLGDEEVCDDNVCRRRDDGLFAWGLNLGVGVRGKITRGLGIGAEFGWGFLSTDENDGDERFFHGIFGAILFEATVGI
jgi:hypothetical protein